MVRVRGIEPRFQAWEAHVIAVILHPQQMLSAPQIGSGGQDVLDFDLNAIRCTRLIGPVFQAPLRQSLRLIPYRYPSSPLFINARTS